MPSKITKNNPETLKIVSAGGFLFDFEKNKVLLLRANHQHGNIVVPKGKIEPGETKEEAAWHEVMEETNYDEIELVAPVGENRFHYRNKVKGYPIPVGAEVDKIVYYFLFRLKGQHQVNKREAHEDFENLWLDFDEAINLITHKNDKELLEKAIEIYKTL
jgi:8-oxo-dGTP pyrophosphatase MutT (NUDIX family)